MARATILTDRLGLQHPIIQAPLAGGGDTPALVAACGDAGALGFIGAAYLTPQQIAEASRAVRSRTRGPSAWACSRRCRRHRCRPMRGRRWSAWRRSTRSWDCRRPPLRRRRPIHSTGCSPRRSTAGASAFSFTFGILPPAAIAAIKARGHVPHGNRDERGRSGRARAGGRGRRRRAGQRGGRAPRDVRGPTSTPGMIGTIALVPQVVGRRPRARDRFGRHHGRPRDRGRPRARRRAPCRWARRS